jgi:hypothetical protein
MVDKLDKITIHWSVTGYQPTKDCYQHYHFIIDGNGLVHSGNKPPESNLESSVDKGTYLEHCGGGNRNNIGVSFAAMLGFVNSKKVGKYPITQKQFEAGVKFIAHLVKEYKIPVTPDHVFTHYEFGLKHRNTPSFGKIDIMYLPHKPNLKPNQIGDFIRSEIKKYC